MPAKMYVMPIPPGNTNAIRAAFAEMEGAREQQCVDNRHVMGVTREFVSLQQTPEGDLLVAYLEGDDPDQAVERMTASGSEYARWIADTVFPPPGAEHLISISAQVLADWRDG